MNTGILIKVFCLVTVIFGTAIGNLAVIGTAIAVFMVIDLHQSGWRSAPPPEPPPGTPSVRISHGVGHEPRKR